MSLSIHRLTEAELEATDEVIMTAYNIQQSRKETLHRYLALQPQGSYVAKDNGSVIGFGAAMDYGPFAYIGLMSVHPSRQKQGVGRLLLEQHLSWIESRGCSTVLLDATPVGTLLYEQFGFMEDDQTVVLRQKQHVPFPHSFPGGVRTLREKGLAQVIAFDAPCFGAQRGAVLTSYWADNPQRALVMHNPKGQITGYLLAQSQTLGPWVALTAEDAEPLLVHVLALPFVSEPGVFVAAHNRNALHLLESYDFREQRVLSHMWKGKYIQRSVMPRFMDKQASVLARLAGGKNFQHGSCKLTRPVQERPKELHMYNGRQGVFCALAGVQAIQSFLYL